MNIMRLPNNLGMLLLGIWLIAWGLVALIPALNGLGRLYPDLPLATLILNKRVPIGA
jgi:hypothetical protein